MCFEFYFGVNNSYVNMIKNQSNVVNNDVDDGLKTNMISTKNILKEEIKKNIKQFKSNFKHKKFRKSRRNNINNNDNNGNYLSKIESIERDFDDDYHMELTNFNSNSQPSIIITKELLTPNDYVFKQFIQVYVYQKHIYIYTYINIDIYISIYYVDMIQQI